jgi:hypothetical protein
VRRLVAVALLVLWASPVTAAIIQICGFEAGTVAAEIVSTSGTLDAAYTVVKRTGSYALRTNPTTTAVGWAQLLHGAGSAWPAVATGCGRAYFRYATKPASNDEPILQVLTSGSVLKLEVRITSAGTLAVYDSTPTIVSTGSTVLAQDTWYRLEILVTEVGGGDADTWALTVDGAAELNDTSDLGASNIGAFRLGKGANRNGNSVDFFYDDVAMDSASCPGAGQVTAMRADGDGAVTVWTIGAGGGAEWENVDELPNDGDTTYLLSTDVATEASSVTLQSASAAGITGTINAVKGVAIAKRDGGTNGNYAVRIRAGGTNSDTASFASGASYGGINGNPRATDPSDSLAWTLADLDGVEVGVVEANNTDRTRVTALYLMVDYVPSAVSTCTGGMMLMGAGKC